MDPILDLRPVRPGLFTYHLRAPGQPARPCNHYFDSMEQCMEDAACALLNYFEHVQLHLQGLPFGTYPVSRLLHEPGRIAEELGDRFARVYGHGAPASRRPHSARPVLPAPS